MWAAPDRGVGVRGALGDFLVLVLVLSRRSLQDIAPVGSPL